MPVQYVNFEAVDVAAYDALVVGSGFAGAVMARELAERAGKRVLVLEKKNHIAGNMYDEHDEAGILVHRYGPHIFHTQDKRAYEYVRRFTEWREYEHEVLANLNGTLVPVPFNKNSMEAVFGPEKAAEYISALVAAFGDEVKVPIIELRNANDPLLAELAQFVYENVFLYYTQKQWGLTPEEVDPSVTARVPVHVSRDNRYFQDAYQGMPAAGYTPLFEAMLSHENIGVCLETDAESVFDLDFAGSGVDAPLAGISLKGVPFTGHIIYTGPIDELFLARFGRLPYRTLEFEYQTLHREQFQPCGTVNYTVSENFTRITEFKHLTGQVAPNTTIMREYSAEYTNPATQIPYYAVLGPENEEHYQRYKALTEPLANFHLLGRLAEFRYYNMDQIISRALALADELCAEG